WRSAEGRYERLQGFATELVRLKVDVLIAHPTVAVQAARRATPSIPIQLPHARTAASTLGLRFRLIEVNSETQLEASFAVLLRDRADALLVVDDPMLGSKRVDIVKRGATA